MEWAMQSKAEEKSRILAKLLGCNETDPHKIVEYLRNVDDLSKLFKEYQKTLSADERRRGLPMIFKPTIERDTVNEIALSLSN